MWTGTERPGGCDSSARIVHLSHAAKHVVSLNRPIRGSFLRTTPETTRLRAWLTCESLDGPFLRQLCAFEAFEIRVLPAYLADASRAGRNLFRISSFGPSGPKGDLVLRTAVRHARLLAPPWRTQTHGEADADARRSRQGRSSTQSRQNCRD